MTIQPFAYYAARRARSGADRAGSLPDPTRRSVRDFGHWHGEWTAWLQHNVLAMSGRAVEAAGRPHLAAGQDGDHHPRQSSSDGVRPSAGIDEGELADAAQLASLADETPEGRSIVVLAKEKYRIRGRDFADRDAVFVPFTAQTRMSGVNWSGREIRKGAADAIAAYVTAQGGTVEAGVQMLVDRIARAGGTPLVVAERARILGVVHLKDIVKGGMRQRFEALRAMGIKTS